MLRNDLDTLRLICEEEASEVLEANVNVNLKSGLVILQQGSSLLHAALALNLVEITEYLAGV